MNKKTKFPHIFCSLIVLFMFLGSSIAYSDAPGVPDPGRRVPPRTQQRTAPPRRPAPPRAAPAPAPVAPPPVVIARCSLEEAIALIKQKRFQRALPLILCVLREQPENADAWYWFGVWNNKTGNFANAQRYFARALEIDHNYPALSRIVVYPGDPHGKIPLWDPRRPGGIESIYPLREIHVIPPGSPESLRESRPDMEIIPETPVYLPPEPAP